MASSGHTPPLEVMASWPTPNYTNPQTRGPGAMLFGLLTFVLAAVVILARYVTQWQRTRAFKVDDYLIGMAFILSAGLTGMSINLEWTHKWDRHSWDVPLSAVSNLMKFGLASKAMYSSAGVLTRFSLYAMYYRLIDPAGIKLYNWIIYAGVIFNLVAWITFLALTIFICVPIKYYWTVPRLPGEGTCLDDALIMMSIGAINSVADVFAFFTPIPLIWHLDIPLKKRIGISFLFSFGLAAVLAGCLRTFFIWKTFYGTWDGVWWSYGVWVCATAEINLGVICACAPILRPYFEKVLDFFLDLVHTTIYQLSPPASGRTVETRAANPPSPHGPLFRGSRSTASSTSGQHPLSRVSNTHEAEWEAYMQSTHTPALEKLPHTRSVECTSNGRVHRQPEIPAPCHSNGVIWKHEEFEITVSKI